MTDTDRFPVTTLFRRPAEPDPDESLPDVLCVDLSAVAPSRRPAVAAAIQTVVRQAANAPNRSAPAR